MITPQDEPALHSMGNCSLRIEGLLRLNEMATELPEKAFMEFGLEWVERLTDSKIAFIHFVNEDQQTLELVSWSSATRMHYCTASFDNHYPVEQAGIWADSLRQKRPVVFNDYASQPGKHGLPEGHSALVRLISVPVIESGLVRVVLGVGNKAEDYCDDDVEIASLFGNVMWRIIRRQRVEAELVRVNEQQRILIEKLETAQIQLFQSEKMASIGQLAAGVAHELNNPVGFINSNMGTLERYMKDLFEIFSAYDDVEGQVSNHAVFGHVRKLKQDRDFDYIRQDIFQIISQSRSGLSRIQRIVSDLREFAHAGEEEWGWVDLHRSIESTLNLLSNELGQRCDVVREYGNLPEVYCMPGQINQVLLNILLNAAQAINGQGRITLRTAQEGENVLIEVRDTGGGIRPQDMPHIFEPFFTTKPVGSATGMGLSLAYSIMQTHHGSIKVESKMGQGTQVRIQLPITQE